MPVFGRTAEECFALPSSHLGSLFGQILGPRHPLELLRIAKAPRAILAFRRGDEAVAIPIDTRFGRLHFYAGQALEAVRAGRRWRLEAVQYWYRLQLGPSLGEKALVRWEYQRRTAADDHCANHLQVRAGIDLGGQRLDLDRLHAPTGTVSIEELLRFLIADLGTRPFCGEAWPLVLAESEHQFEQLTGEKS